MVNLKKKITFFVEGYINEGYKTIDEIVDLLKQFNKYIILINHLKKLLLHLKIIW